MEKKVLSHVQQIRKHLSWNLPVSLGMNLGSQNWYFDLPSLAGAHIYVRLLINQFISREPSQLFNIMIHYLMNETVSHTFAESVECWEYI